MTVPTVLIACVSETSKMSEVRAGETRDKKLKLDRYNVRQHMHLQLPVANDQCHMNQALFDGITKTKLERRPLFGACTGC